MTTTVLSPRGNSKPPYGSFAGKPQDVGSKTFVRNFTVLGLGGYSRPLWGSFAGKVAQVIIPPAAVGTVGGTRRHKHFRREEWEALLEEIRLEKEALEAPTRAKKALQAIAQAERQAAQLAEQLEYEEAEQLARVLVSAERAKTAVDALKRANAAVKMMADLQARMDEDDDDVMLLLLS